MADHIPFLTSEDGASLIRRVYSDSATVRVPMDRAIKLLPMLPTTSKVWIDPCVDGMDDIEIRRVVQRRNAHGVVVQSSPNPWFTFMSAFAKFEKVATSLQSPVAADVTAFVFAILDECAAHNPEWVTVPQLPLVDGSERNKVNRLLASAAGKWKVKNGCSRQFILPLIFTNQRQINGKTARTPRVRQAERLYLESHADGLWVVDKSLCDESGAGNLRDTRVPGIIDMHEELNAKIPARIRVAGPYWALNLVLGKRAD